MDGSVMRKLFPELKIAHADLQDQLNETAQGTFSAAHRQQTQRLINQALSFMEQTLLGNMTQAGEQYNLFGANMAEKEVKTFQGFSLVTPSVNKDLVSLAKNDFLLNNMRASLQTYNANTRRQVSDALTQAVLQKRTGYEVSTRIGKFLKLERWKILRIVRTELAKIFNQTKLLSYGNIQEKYFPDMMKRMFHPMDARTAPDSKQWAKLDPAIPISQPFRLVIKHTRADGSIRKEVQEGMTPPLRTNDRALLIPFRPKWAKKQEA